MFTTDMVYYDHKGKKKVIWKMNILFFLTPKTNVSFLYNDYSVAKALETVYNSHYTALPMIDRDGKYIRTITEGDFLWGLLKHHEITKENVHTTRIGEITGRVKNQAVSVSANMEDLLEKAKDQNFVPVVDDDDVFIGIITRKDILQYCYDVMDGKKEA